MAKGWDPDPVFYQLSAEALFATLLFGEARNQDLIGKVAVASVVRNRVERTAAHRQKRRLDLPLWKRVILNPWDFSCFDDQGGQLNYNRVVDYAQALAANQPIDKPLTIELSVLVNLCLSGLLVDPTGGATHYHTVGLTPPNWATDDAVVYRDANHIFYKLDDKTYDIW